MSDKFRRPLGEIKKSLKKVKTTEDGEEVVQRLVNTIDTEVRSLVRRLESSPNLPDAKGWTGAALTKLNTLSQSVVTWLVHDTVEKVTEMILGELKDFRQEVENNIRTEEEAAALLTNTKSSQKKIL